MKFVDIIIKIKSYLYYKIIYPYDLKRPNIVIKYNAQSKKLNIQTFNGFQSRNEATLIFFLDVFSIAKKNAKKDLFFKFYTGDYPTVDGSIFSYSSQDKSKVIDIPDFDFVSWKEANIYDYQQQVDKIIEESNKPFQFNKLFWIGNINTHPSRRFFLDTFSDDTLIECRQLDPNLPNFKNDFVTLEDHCKYKYLIDLQGNGFSARLKYLLFTGRPLLIQNRKWKTYYHKMLIPFEHFIPVNEDLSDLKEKINFLELNPDVANKIALNAQKFAMDNLNKINVFNYYLDQINNFIIKQNQ